MRKLLLFFLLASPLLAQTHTFPATDTNNTFTGYNVFPCVKANNVRCVDSANSAGWSGTDFGAWVNSAIASTTTTGSVVFMANNGDVTVSTTITVDRPVTLVGMGRAGRLIPGNGFAGPVIKVVKTGNSLTNQFNQQIGVRLQNIWIEDPNFRSQNTDGIWVVGTDELQTQDVEVKWLKGYALQLDNNGNNNTPVRESIFRNFVSWGNGDPAQTKASIMMITNSFPGSDEINEIRFDGGGVKYEWYEAVRIGTGQTGVNPLGPRHIYFHNFQIEARQSLDCAATQGGCAEPPAVAPLSDNFHVLQANNIVLDKCSVSNAGQGKSAIRLDGATTSPITSFVVNDSVVGGAPVLTGTVNTNGTTVTWVSGNQFQPFDATSWAGLTIVINGSNFTVSSINSLTSLTLTGSAGVQSGVSYTVTSGGWGITESYVNGITMSGVRWLTNPLGNFNPTIVNTANYTINELPTSGTPASANDVFGLWYCIAGDCVLGLKNNTSPNGQEWGLDSKSDGTMSIFPRGNAAQVLSLGGTTGIPLGTRYVEQATPGFGAASGFDFCYGDSTSHALQCSFNNGPTRVMAQQGTLTLKKGTGAGNYTTANTTYTVADSTNLCLTVTIPTGWKLAIDASGDLGTATAAVIANVAITDNASCSTANSGILLEATVTGTAAGVLEPFSLNWVINGDGASHNVALQYKTSAGADSATILNASATQLPTMVFTLMPSN